MGNTFIRLGFNSNPESDRCSRIWKLTKTLGKILFLALLTIQSNASAAVLPPGYSVNLAWDKSSSSEVAGYRVHYGTTRENYSMTVDVGDVTTKTVTGLVGGTTYYFTVTSYDAQQLESVYSNQINFTPGRSTVQFDVNSGRPVLTIRGTAGHTYDIEATEDFVTWTPVGTVTLNSSTMQFVDPNAPNFSKRFYRTRDRQP